MEQLYLMKASNKRKPFRMVLDGIWKKKTALKRKYARKEVEGGSGEPMSPARCRK